MKFKFRNNLFKLTEFEAIANCRCAVLVLLEDCAALPAIGSLRNSELADEEDIVCWAVLLPKRGAIGAEGMTSELLLMLDRIGGSGGGGGNALIWAAVDAEDEEDEAFIDPIEIPDCEGFNLKE